MGQLARNLLARFGWQQTDGSCTNPATPSEGSRLPTIGPTWAASWWQTFARTLDNWLAHEGLRLAASLSLYSLLSLAPLVIICIAVVSFAFGRPAAQNAVVNEVRSLMGADGAQAVKTIIEYGKMPHTGGLTSALGILTLLFGASSIFSELQSALNKIWEVESQQGLGFLDVVKSRLFSFALVLALGFLLLVSLLLSAALAALGEYFSAHLSMPQAVLAVMDAAVSFVGVSALIAIILRYVPDVRPRWQFVAEGAVATALLFTVGKALLGFYIGKAAVGSAYGAAGSLIVVIVWTYYSAMIFYFGAEFTRVRAQAGSRRRRTGADNTRHFTSLGVNQ